MQKQLATIDKDITIVENKLLPLENTQKKALPFADPPSSPSSSSSLSSSSTTAQEQQAIVPTVSPPPEEQPSTSATTTTASSQPGTSADSPSVICKTVEATKGPRGEERLASRKVRVHSNFEELLEDYFTAKIPAHQGERYLQCELMAKRSFCGTRGNCVPSQ